MGSQDFSVLQSPFSSAGYLSPAALCSQSGDACRAEARDRMVITLITCVVSDGVGTLSLCPLCCPKGIFLNGPCLYVGRYGEWGPPEKIP